jgi:hypothetical protein
MKACRVMGVKLCSFKASEVSGQTHTGGAYPLDLLDLRLDIPRTSMDVMAKGKVSSVSGIEFRPLSPHPVTLVTHLYLFLKNQKWGA